MQLAESSKRLVKEAYKEMSGDEALSERKGSSTSSRLEAFVVEVSP